VGCVCVCVCVRVRMRVRVRACVPWHLTHTYSLVTLLLPQLPACRAEAEFVLCLYKHMLGAVPDLQDGTASVAVISPYKAQVCVCVCVCGCVCARRWCLSQ
jgi:hypothetical protein